MNIVRPSNKPNAEKWARYKYNLTTAIGENGTRVTGCPRHINLSRRAAGEGMVLLENNGILPLREGSRVALFGIGSLDYVKGGGGSGQVYCAYTRNIYEGFKEKEPRFSVYEPLTKYYYDYTLPLLSQYDAKDNSESLFDEIELPESLVKSAAENSDVAVITIHRFSGEDWDRSAKKGDFYLTDTEQKLIDDVTSAFEHSVVVL
ncbi:MAG: glycoside hydrolase family 3 C-terminal domain-containing protein, partial [Oscillospiraceae bacterium]|nr:glycoside hydrolase family 3 C-terminal domain-containing protein [Oscillospiraceae bacterium]